MEFLYKYTQETVDWLKSRNRELEAEIAERRMDYGEDCKRLDARIAELEQRLAAEKKRMIYYQDIVYSVCNVLDIDDRHSGNVIVCGTAEEPCSDVETRIQQLTAELDRLELRFADPTGHGWRNVEPRYDEEGYDVGDGDAGLSVGVQAEIGYTPPETVEQRLRRKGWM